MSHLASESPGLSYFLLLFNSPPQVIEQSLFLLFSSETKAPFMVPGGFFAPFFAPPTGSRDECRRREKKENRASSSRFISVDHQSLFLVPIEKTVQLDKFSLKVQNFEAHKDGAHFS